MKGVPERAAEPVRQAARQAAPWVVGLARAGYAAHGVVYLVVALLAMRAARGGGSPGGTEEAMREVERQPGGDWMLWLLAIGLAGFALWRFVQAALDPEGKGAEDPAKGAAHRVRYAGSGVVHGALALAAARMASGGSGGGDSWYSSGLSPLGKLAVAAAALGFLAYGAYQVYRAYRVDLDDQLDLSRLRSASRTWVVRAARAGIAARGVVFAMIGVLLGQAALRRGPDESPGLQGALRALQEQPFGKYLLGLIAVGLAGYGIYELVRARYRRISPG